MRYVKFENHVMIAFHIKEVTLNQLNNIKDNYTILKMSIILRSLGTNHAQQETTTQLSSSK